MSWRMNCQPCNVNRRNRYSSNATYFLSSCVRGAGGFRIFGFRVGHWWIVPRARGKADFYSVAGTYGQSVHPTITDSQGRVYYDRGAGTRGGGWWRIFFFGGWRKGIGQVKEFSVRMGHNTCPVYPWLATGQLCRDFHRRAKTFEW